MTENCLEIEDVLKCESLEPCKGKKATFGWLAKAALKITKIQIFSSGMNNVCLFEVITKASVSSDKNVPLMYVYILNPIKIEIEVSE